MRRLVSSLLLAATFAAFQSGVVSAEPKHGIAMHGEPQLAADFTHLPYVNPDAPKGGRIDYAWPGTFDSVNPFIVQGSAARGSVDLVFGDLVFDRLMIRAQNEPFTLYPLLAKTVETDAARTFVEFTLDERAKFSDGEPVKPEDVIFTIELLRDKGLPRYGVTAKKIEAMQKVGDHGVRLTFKQPDRELPLILGSLPILPKHAINAETFDKSSLTPMIGSGPYRLDSVKAGEMLTFKRNPDYWAKDIPSKRGVDNYDEIRLSYFRDDNALFEAFKKGLVDVFIEDNSGRWADGYGFAAVTDGKVVKETFPTQTPSGMFSIVMNGRRQVFADRAVRDALTSLFDFEAANRTLLSGAYTRTKSFYDNSDLSSYGKPASDAEKALLAPFPGAVTDEVLAGGWQPPTSDGSGRDRAFLKTGVDKLKAAGFEIKGGKMVSSDGKPLAFEIMLKGKESEQLAIAWQQTLARIGIEMTIRSVDASQFLERQVNYDFDAMFFNYTSSLSPGVEQVARWGSAARETPGTFNYAGVANPAVDALIDRLINATTRDEFVEAVRAYDRVLLSGAYVVPLYFRPEQWVARWSHIKRPDTTPIYGFQLPTWWREN